MIHFESDVLDISERKKIIKEIEGPENHMRKNQVYVREEMYNDLTYKYVFESLKEQLSSKSIREMQYSISNINILKKVIDKLSRVYTYGVSRSLDDSNYQQSLDTLVDKLDMNNRMKLANRQYRRDLNAALYARPTKTQDSKEDIPVYHTELSVLPPYLYDVIESQEDRHTPLVYILSSFDQRANTHYTSLDAAYRGRYRSLNVPSDGIDQVIADRKEDVGKGKHKTYIWWTAHYHFTTDKSGEIVSGPDITNPIGELPFVELSARNVNNFWSEGGDDLVQGTVLINSMLSHINNIGVVQGYGQFYAMGEKLTRQFEFGPNKALLFEYSKEDVKPDIGFVSASPNLRALLDVVETYTALLLSTRNLSTSAVKMSLDGGLSAPSGVAMMLDKAESTEDVEDQRSIFVSADPKIISKINRMNNYFYSNNLLNEAYEDCLYPPELEANILFGKSSSLMTETEKVDMLSKRKDLGLNTKVELIRLDNPDLTYEEAEQKLLKLQEERAATLLLGLHQK
jgi:hypothetical protein